MGRLGPRLVVAGTHSGVGKTTVATGLMAALRARGVRVASAKVGPDYVDPGYHSLATGRPPRNLDAWICGADAIGPLAARAAVGAEVLIIEGVMGLFDGAAEDGTASTAHVARLLDAPVVLVVDAAAMSGSVAALVHGFRSFDPRLRVAGIVLNRVGSDGHEALLRHALESSALPVLGVLRRDDALVWRDRHLGLVPVAEQPDVVRRSVASLGATVRESFDLDAIVALATTAPVRSEVEPAAAAPSGLARVAVADGPAFSFRYPDNLEALVQAGAELAPFDPLEDVSLPAGCTALYAGGGFPEVFAPDLAANTQLLADVRRQVQGGLVTWAECGGLLWLAESLDEHGMAGVIPAAGRMTGRLSLGYRRAVTQVDSPVAEAGRELRGHEFHYSAVDPPGDALLLSGRSGSGRGGFGSATLFASYLHQHLGADPSPAERFVAASTSPE